MTPEQNDAINKIVKDLEPPDAIALVLTLALCSDLTLNLSPDQRRDILLSGLDAYGQASYVNMVETILIEVKGQKPSPEQVYARVRYTGVKSADRASEECRRLFTLCEMLKP